MARPSCPLPFLEGRIPFIFCPKLDRDLATYLEKLAAIFTQHTLRSILLHREVPCCGGVRYVGEKTLAKAGATIPVSGKTVAICGENHPNGIRKESPSRR